MDQQKMDFSQNTIQQINIYHQSEKKESYNDGHQVKLTPTQKQALQNIANEHGIKISTFLREALDTYLELFPYREKIIKHKNLIQNLLKSLD